MSCLPLALFPSIKSLEGFNMSCFIFSRETERANPFFSLQRRKGHGGGGFTSILIGTLDNVLDNKVSIKK